MWHNNINDIHHTLHIIIAHKNISQAMHYNICILEATMTSNRIALCIYMISDNYFYICLMPVYDF